MTQPKSTTKDASGLVDSALGTKTYETRISDGNKSVSGLGSTPEKSQASASGKWDTKK